MSGAAGAGGRVTSLGDQEVAAEGPAASRSVSVSYHLDMTVPFMVKKVSGTTGMGLCI